MTDNFVIWFILGQVDSVYGAQFRENARNSDVSENPETEQSGKKTCLLVKFAAQRRTCGARSIARQRDRVIAAAIGALAQR